MSADDEVFTDLRIITRGVDLLDADTDDYLGSIESISDARRIVACVNACRGIPTSSLDRLLATDQTLDDVITTAVEAGRALERKDGRDA